MFFDVPAMQQPEAYIGNAAKLFADTGKLVDDDRREFFRKFGVAFEAWIDRHVAR